MENIILSLLILKEMTIYQIRAYIQQKLSTVCSDSLGSIQAALKKLLDRGDITVSEYTENNILKKRYCVTAKGVAHYKAWLGTPINVGKMKTMEEGKFFFLGMAPAEKRIAFLRQYIDDLKAEYRKLCEIKRFTDENQTAVIQKSTQMICGDGAAVDHLKKVSGENDPEKVIGNLYAYQMYLLAHGLKGVQSDIEFYEEILEKELEG